jgi:L-lactate dehydrogenase (cytochrome)
MNSQSSQWRSVQEGAIPTTDITKGGRGRCLDDHPRQEQHHPRLHLPCVGCLIPLLLNWLTTRAMAKLGHPDGEVNLTKGAANTGIIQIISSNASCSLDEMQAARSPGQPLFFQLYINRNRSIATDLLKKINSLDMDAIFLTGDAPVGGKRERDLRLKGEFEGPAGGVSEKSDDTKGVSQAMFAGVDPNVNWEDIK